VWFQWPLRYLTQYHGGMPDTGGLGELWVRTSRLCERCDMLVSTVALPPGWEVAFRRRDDQRLVVTGRDELVLFAIAKAVEKAEEAAL
jgi:hypothetical protein